MSFVAKIFNKYFHRSGDSDLYTVLGSYYSKDSSYLFIDIARGRKLNETSRQILHGFTVNTFIPFLRKSKINSFNEIKPVVMGRFQNYLLFEKGLRPQSINRQIGGIKAIFNHLFMTGVIEQNIIKDIVPLRNLNNKIRSCFTVEELKGIFKEKWPEKKFYLFCSLIYSTGIRNGELQSLRVKHIILKGDLHFLNVTKSKTDAGIRLIPLHTKIFEALKWWIDENHLSGEDFLFVRNDKQRIFREAKKAHLFMGSLLGKKPEELEAENITFYSGRHFYKTMLNLHNLGDIEELFMGHKVNKQISERYNHKDKRGEKELLKQARKAIEIVDITLFQ